MNSSKLRAFVDATPTSDLLMTFAQCGIMVRICNVILSAKSMPQHLVYRPSFSVSFGYEGREILQYIDEPDLNQALTNGILWLSEHTVSNTGSAFVDAMCNFEYSK